MSERMIPHDLDAEASLLGAIMLRPVIMKDLLGTVDIRDFYRPAHQTVYGALAEMYETGLPIDIVTLGDQLRKGTLIEEVGGMEVLTEIQGTTPSISNFARYADVVIECSRRRRIIANLADTIDAAFNRSTDVDDVVKQAESINADDLIASRSAEISGLYSLAEFIEKARVSAEADEQPWLVPHILKPRWRTIIVATEGIGKAVLMRFIAVHAAAGRDLWDPKRFIEPRKVLYIDTENPEETIVHQMEIANVNPSYSVLGEAMESGNLHIWHEEGGMNLRERRAQARFEAVIQKVRPEIAFIGPLYKCFKRGRGEDLEQATMEFTEFIDEMRVRYDFAVVLEHHAPKASGAGFRELNPFGSSLLMRWPELGITLDPKGDAGMTDDRYELNVGRFRRDRVANDWPQIIERNPRSFMAWTPFFLDGRGRRIGVEIPR